MSGQKNKRALFFLSLLGAFLLVTSNISWVLSDIDTNDSDEIYDIQVLAPNGGEKLVAGQKFEISWYAGSAIEYVRIEYSTDGGKTWTIIANDIKMQDNYGYYTWKVPCIPSDICELKISDAYGMRYDYSFGSFSIVDNQPPKLVVTLQRKSLWPPNHEMIDVGLKYSVVDNCDPAPKVAIRITSDEPTASDTSSGGSKYSPDAVIEKDGRVLLRAECSGEGDGRVYHITITARDSSGNVSRTKVYVRVNREKNRIAVDSGQFYDATTKN